MRAPHSTGSSNAASSNAASSTVASSTVASCTVAHTPAADPQATAAGDATSGLAIRTPGGTSRPVSAELVSQDEGASVRRIFPTLSLRTLDPFVVLDEVALQPGAALETATGRGFESLTYVLDGQLAGDDWTIPSGGAQRVRCAEGPVAPALPFGDSRHHGLSLWVDVPRRLDSTTTEAQSVGPQQLPVQVREGVTVRTIAGEGSPMQVMTPMRWLDVEMASGAAHRELVPAGWNGLVYVIAGQVRVGSEVLSAGAAAFPGPLGEGERGFELEAIEPSRVTVIAGRPHHDHDLA